MSRNQFVNGQPRIVGICQNVAARQRASPSAWQSLESAEHSHLPISDRRTGCGVVRYCVTWREFSRLGRSTAERPRARRRAV
jgi:hypothetical protein